MSLQPSEYFISALEAQRSINAHINEIEPSTPVVLFEIDLNEIKPATIAYPGGNPNGPIVSGVLRLHNDFNLFNINRGIIQWKNNYYVPFPIFGEQFDITSNGTIPTPKLKFSSQYLDDEYNSFYKYIRMQINELKDIVGAKVTRRKSFVRYLHPDNFAGRVNPFNEFSETPWASREGDTLTVRSNYPVPPPSNMAKWLVYYPKPNYGTKAKIFTSFKNQFRNKTLTIISQQNNYTIESEDFFSLLVNDKIENDADIEDSFVIDAFVISGSNNFNKIISDQNLEFTDEFNTKIKLLCNSNSFNPLGDSSGNFTINYPVNFSENSNSLMSLISLKSNVENSGFNTSYAVINQSQSGFDLRLSSGMIGNYDINYLTITTGYYTGINPYSNQSTKLFALKIRENWSGFTGNSMNIDFPFEFSNSPKIFFNSWGDSGRAINPSGYKEYVQYIDNITSTGIRLNASIVNPGDDLGIQNFNILLTDYITEEESPTGSAQIFSSNGNLAIEYKELLSKKSIDTYEVELVPDVYYIDRKTQEDSNNVVYELSSLLDIEGVKLPCRTLLSKNCPFTYRGEGCVYESKDRLTIAHSGVYGYVVMDTEPGPNGGGVKALSTSQRVKGLNSAPPVADDKDMLFTGYINKPNWSDRGPWGHNISYQKNNYIYIEKNDIKYYFVCDQDHISNAINAPPNDQYWKSDTCSKTLKGCRLRWRENPNFPNITIKATFDTLSNTDINGNVRTVEDIIYQYDVKAPLDADGKQLIGLMPFGGFPSVEGKYQTQQGSQTST